MRTRLKRWWCGMRTGHVPRTMLSLGPQYGTGPARFLCIRCAYKGGY